MKDTYQVCDVCGKETRSKIHICRDCQADHSRHMEYADMHRRESEDGWPYEDATYDEDREFECYYGLQRHCKDVNYTYRGSYSKYLKKNHLNE